MILLDSLKRGGVQQGVLLLAPRLDRAKYEVQVWSLRDGKKDRALAGEFEAVGVPVAFYAVDGFHDRRGILKLAAGLRRGRIELLNTRSFLPNIIGRMAAVIAGTPVVVANYHHTYEHRWTRKYVACERVLRNYTASFVCVSKAVKDFLQPIVAFEDERTKVIYNGLDVQSYASGVGKEELRKRIGLPEGGPIIAYIGRLAPIKDVPTFIRSASVVLRDLPEARFLVVGGGESRKELEELVRSMDLGRVVSFLGSRQDVPDILNAVDCLVLPSLAEGFPRIILEAFASRTPVVTTPASGVAEIVEHEETGLIVPFKDTERLAASILKTLKNNEETLNRCEKAFLRVQEFTLDSWVQQVEDVFDVETEREEYGKIEVFYANAANRLFPFERHLQYWELKMKMRIVTLFASGRQSDEKP